MALSRMGYLPGFVTAVNSWRGTPHFAILLATAIPIVVLIGVQGQIDILGDLYAFGLLGAFLVTCLSMIVIRYRERHNASHIGAVQAAEQAAGLGAVQPTGEPWHRRIGNAAGARMHPQVAARLRTVGAQTQRRISPWTKRARDAWPTLEILPGHRDHASRRHRLDYEPLR